MNTILHIMNYAASYRGNFIESLENLDTNLQKEGYRNVYLFCEDAKNTDAHVWIQEMSSRGLITKYLSSSFNENTKIIRSIISEYSVKIVHTHFVSSKQFLNIKCAVPKSIPIIIHMHNHSNKGNFVKNAIRKFLYNRCIFIACSDSVFDSLKRDYPANEKYKIDNGVNFSRLDSFSEISEAEYSIPKNSTKFLVFGFDFYRKGVDLALKAINDLRKNGTNYVLMISLSTNFEYVEEQVKLILGEIPDWVKIIKARNDVATLYNYVDIFLSPSREEGLPYSVIEAGYSKCSVVLSDISAQKHMKLKYGYWFNSENVDDLKEKILLAQDEHSEKLANIESVREYMKSSYSLNDWSMEVVSLYKSVLERNK